MGAPQSTWSVSFHVHSLLSPHHRAHSTHTPGLLLFRVYKQGGIYYLSLDHLETQHQVMLSHCLNTSCLAFLCSSSLPASLSGEQGAYLVVSLPADPQFPFKHSSFPLTLSSWTCTPTSSTQLPGFIRIFWWPLIVCDPLASEKIPLITS